LTATLAESTWVAGLAIFGGLALVALAAPLMRWYERRRR
jgi:hypothetical protein